MVTERDEMAIAVEAGLEMMEAGRAVEIVTQIVGAIPQQLHRHAGVLRNGGNLHGVVARATPAEAAAAARVAVAHAALLSALEKFRAFG
jgi:hypothetical protein